MGLFLSGFYVVRTSRFDVITMSRFDVNTMSRFYINTMSFLDGQVNTFRHLQNVKLLIIDIVAGY